MPSRRVLLCSGGVDSFAIWWLLRHAGGSSVRPVYFRLGHPYEEVELETLRRLEEACRRAGLPFGVEMREDLSLGQHEQPDGYIPLRNLLLVAAGSIGEDVSTVYIGALRSESSRDKSRRFFRETSRMLSYLHGRSVNVEAPARRYTKAQLIGRFLRRWPEGVEFLRLTRSCYKFRDYQEDVVGCGECMACFRRWVAMTLNGVEESYAALPWEWATAKDRGEWRRHLRRAALPELPAILRSNLDAWRALRRRAA